MIRRTLGAVLLGLLALLLLAPAALATTPTNSLSLTSDQSWLIVIAGLGAPALSYVVNRYLPPSERLRSALHVVVAAAVGALYKLAETGNFAINGTNVKYVVIAVGSAVAAHHGFFKPGEWDQVFKGTAPTTPPSPPKARHPAAR